MTRAGWIRIGVAVAIVLALAWLVRATEWAEREVEVPPKGEAARNDFFAFEQLMQRLGVQLERRQALDAMPPPDAVLVLLSSDWDLFPERVERLRRWVDAGGHLVIPAARVGDEALADWLPVETVEVPAPADASRRRPAPPCRRLVANDAARAAGAAETYEICAPPFFEGLQAAGARPEWSLGSPTRIEMLRVPYGRGRVTVHGPWSLLENRQLLRADAAPAMAASLQLRAGTRLWLVPDETRAPLPAWLWQRGKFAIVLLLAALLAWLWRGAVRFGPLGALPALERRSMKEQLRGTAGFLRNHGSATLHAAQVRALHDAARLHLPGYASLQGDAAVQAIARATALSSRAIAGALAPGERKPQPLAGDLALLEEARRRLLRAAPPPLPPAPHAHPT